MLIDGVHVPLTAPFYRDGRSYLRKLEHNVARYSLSPAAGMVALGPGMEAAALSDAETLEFLETVAQTAARDKVLVAGVARDSVRGTLALADHAARAGFDAVLVEAPRDWMQLERDADYGWAELRVFFQSVADASPLPVLLSSVASTAGSLELPVEIVAELAAHENVLGMYDAGGSVERYHALAAATASARREVKVTTVFAPVTRRMLEPQHEVGATFVSADTLGGGGAALAVAAPVAAVKTRTKTVGFQIMAAGSAAGMLSLLEAGAAGAMPLLAACAPQACYEVLAAFKDGDRPLAAEKAERLAEADALVRDLGIAGLKYGCDWNGYFGGNPRLPRLPLRADARQQVETALREVRH